MENILNAGSTGAIGLIEFELSFERDLSELLDCLILSSENYEHAQTCHDGNSHSSLQTTLSFD